MEFLYEYGLFLAKAATLVIAILLVVGTVLGMAMKQKKHKGELDVTCISDKLEETKESMMVELLDKDEYKKHQKALKKAEKQKESDPETKPRLFVINFEGSMDAHEVDALREELTAILAIAKPEDKVLVKVESGGGVVHGYGLAASQLQRIRNANLDLTIVVDKVAASGGYMMACVANRIIAAPFAILGSIGVIAMVPNVHRLLKQNNVDVEQHTAGEYKRTLTVLGENTDAGREKFKQELEEVHVLFKDFVRQHRPELDIEKIATGETWFGTQALEMGLVDEIGTSDDVILQASKQAKVYAVKYHQKKNLAEKLSMSAATVMQGITNKLWKQSREKYTA